VTASRRAQLATTVPASITVLSAREIEARNSIRLDDALRYVSGLQMQDNQVNLRGSSGFAYNTGSRVLLLLDGSQLLSPDTDGVPLDIVPMTQVEQIEVLKGPGSALYGSGAIGGVINVITKKYPDRPRTSLQSYGGFYEKAKHDVWRSAWNEADDLRWFAGVRFDHARSFGSGGGWISLSYRKDVGYMNFQQNEYFQGYGKLGWQFSDRLHGDFLLGALFREKDSFLFWNGLSDALNPGSLSLTRSTVPTGSNDNFSNQFSFLPTLRFFPSASSLLTGRLRLFGTVIRPIDDDTGEIKPLSDGTWGFRYGGELQYSTTLQRGGTITAGTSFDANTTRSSFFRTRDGDELGSQPEIAAFGQWETDLTKTAALVAGLRFDLYRVDATETVTRLSPKLAISQSFGEALVARVAAGMGFRVPSLAERFTDDQSFIPIFRNPRLKPETNSSVEAGLRGWIEMGSVLRGLEWDVAAFWNTYDNFIEPRFVNGVSSEGERVVGFQFINLEESRIAGAELNVSGVLLDERLRVSVGYTYLDTNDPSGEELPYRPRHLVVTGATMRLRTWLEAGLDYRFASIPDKIDSDFAIFVPDASVLETTHVTDARLIATVRRLSVSLILSNAFDYYYLERPALLAPPRSATLKLQLDL
ncbi:MAG: TonB-dependent receptor, partial [Rhodothermales bacterium]|nr:TonB-dependent receptor [Rhodothermales bacterium]